MQPTKLLAALAFLLGSAALAEPLALTNATLIDGAGSSPRPGRTILIEDGTIRGVFGDGEQELPAGATIVDLGGRTVLPGLIDGHVHLVPAENREGALRALLHRGITTVRELAGDARISGELARRQANGEIEAPAIHYSAVLFGPPFLDDPRASGSARGIAPGTAGWSRMVTAQSDIADVIADARATGATGVKLYASLDAPLVAALTAEAHRQGLKVWAHSVTFPARPGEMIAAGVDSIIHSRGLVAEGRADVPDDFAEGTQIWIRGLDFGAADPESPLFARLFAEMRRQGTVFEPALHADGDPARGPAGDWRDAMRDWSCRITGAAYRAGVTISAGTDTPAAAGALQRELERLVECGLSPLEAIRAATLNNARALGNEATHGSVEPGKAADLLVVEGNPAEDIAATRNVYMVAQAGRILTAPGAPD